MNVLTSDRTKHGGKPSGGSAPARPFSAQRKRTVKPSQGTGGEATDNTADSARSDKPATATTPSTAKTATTTPTTSVRGRSRHKRSRGRLAAEWAFIFAVAFSVAMLVRATVVQAFFIPSESMTPTLEIGDRLLVDKVSFRVREIHRSEVIVFKRPSALKEDYKDLIKRVIGLPGDLVEGRDNKVFINGVELDESAYLPAGTVTEAFAPVRVPVDAYFVMGDNRSGSYDSRAWGTVDSDLVVGKAIITVWPVNRASFL
jgi:signal peptidase I